MATSNDSFYSNLEDQLIVEGDFSYIEEGEGPVFILLHGLFGALSNFRAVTDFLSDRFTVVIPRLPIYELPVLNTNVKAIAKFLAKFIDHKGYDQVNLLGNSLGGHVGLVYAAEHPERVSSMVLSGSSGLYENAFGGSFPRREDKNYLREKIALTFYDPAMVTDELVDECHEAVNNRNKVIRILSIAKSAIRHNMAKELENYKMPVCLIWGKNDTITPPEVAEEFHAKIENSTLYWIDKCGHAPMMEHPEEFNRYLGEWIEKTPVFN
ncbi:MAG: alpha/beta hydrolase [Flavobacteriales bacterium]|nr:alpha/beta hydrolase [Flavobacteriales bacterium]